MEKPKVEVNTIPDLIKVDQQIRRLHERMSRLEAMMHRAMQQGGPGWITQVGNLALEMEKIVDTVRRVTIKYNNIRARLFK